ncbi:MAG: hypothetical protein ACRECW_16205 [Phyllobacterium sp.]
MALRAGKAIIVLACLVALSPDKSAIAQDMPWTTGGFTFSDELGGFRILSAQGSGRPDDPIIITEALDTASPSTLVIRWATRDVRYNSFIDPSMELHLRIVAINSSRQNWVEFEFELQENLGTPSIYGDGLSFNQRQSKRGAIDSDRFLTYDDKYEPADRLAFRDGAIDPGQSGYFQFIITDFTPKYEIYLLQDPRIPSS